MLTVAAMVRRPRADAQPPFDHAIFELRTADADFGVIKLDSSARHTEKEGGAGGVRRSRPAYQQLERRLLK